MADPHGYPHQEVKKIINFVQVWLQTTLIDYYATRLWLCHFRRFLLLWAFGLILVTMIFDNTNKIHVEDTAYIVHKLVPTRLHILHSP